MPAGRQKSLAPLPDADKAKAQQALAATDGGGGGAKLGRSKSSAVELAPPPPAPTPGKPLAVESGKKGAPGLQTDDTPDEDNEEVLVVKASGPSLKRVCRRVPAGAHALRLFAVLFLSSFLIPHRSNMHSSLVSPLSTAPGRKVSQPDLSAAARRRRWLRDLRRVQRRDGHAQARAARRRRAPVL